MAVKSRKKGNVSIVEFSGKIAIGPATQEMAAEVKRLLDSGERLLVFDMLEVPWLDSAGIGETVACYKRIRDRDAKVVLVVKGKAHDLFTLYELTKVFEVYDDVEAALASFAG